MLLRSETLSGIKSGGIKLAFRSWTRPTVRSGGTLATGAGEVQIGTVTPVDVEGITTAEALLAGFESLESLLTELSRRPAGTIYRIELLGLRPDPSVALRESVVDAASAADLNLRLCRLDAASRAGAWTHRTLRAIRDHPGLRASDLCSHVGYDRDAFKVNVRKLKRLGLTISLETGYRLSPRGESYLATQGPEANPTDPV